MKFDDELKYIIFGIGVALIIATLIGYTLKKSSLGKTNPQVVNNFNQRTNAWWVMCIILLIAITSGTITTIILFAIISFLALREFITLIPTHRADHRTLFWIFFILVPAQYYLVSIEWYGLFTILIPVYTFLLLPVRLAISAETENFLARTARLQWALMICIYCVSHAPAILILDITDYQDQNFKLLLFLIIVVQLSDVMQYVCGKLAGKHKIAPKVSPNKTIEGFIGGILLASAIGTAIYWITPFSPWQAFGMALLANLMGFAGGLCMSAIKRDSGVKDFGTILSGHGGILDRIDSLCFAAPVFFHFTRFFFTN